MNQSQIEFWKSYSNIMTQETPAAVLWRQEKAFTMYQEIDASVYAELDPASHSKKFLRVCNAYNLEPDVFEHFVREQEGWPLDA